MEQLPKYPSTAKTAMCCDCCGMEGNADALRLQIKTGRPTMGICYGCGHLMIFTDNPPALRPLTKDEARRFPLENPEQFKRLRDMLEKMFHERGMWG